MALRVTETRVGGERMFIGTAQDISERTRAREDLRALNAFVISLLQQNTLDDLLWTTAQNIGELLDFEDCVIYLVEGDTLVQAAAYGAKNPQGRDIQSPITIPVGGGIVGTVAKTGIAEIIPDTRKDARYILDEFSGRSELTVPIIYQDAVLGVLDSEGASPDHFSTADLDQFQSIANIAASRIASALEERERRRAEDALRAANEELERRVEERTAELSRATERTQRIIDSAHDGVITIDPGGRIAEWNPSAEQMFGWSNDQAIGQMWTHFIIPERYHEVVKDSMSEMWRRAENRANDSPFEAKGRRHTGEEFPVEMYLAPLPDEQGRAFTCFIRDITDRRQAELARLAAREQEVTIGAAIQENFLRGHPPDEMPGLSIGYASRPSQRLDGDFVDFLVHGGQRVDVLLGDVMGKGVPAALLGAATKSRFARAFTGLMTAAGGQVPSPVEVVTDVHQNVTQRLVELESFVTACYARFDLEARHVEFVDCGHPKTLHYDASTGRCDALEGDNLPLGFVPEHVYEQRTVAFETDDLFVMYSDGLTEARAPDGEMFGPERLRDVIVSSRDHQPMEIIEIIEQHIWEFAGQNIYADDLSVVVLRIGTPAQGQSQGRREMTVARAVDSLKAARDFIAHCLPSTPPLRDGFVSELQVAVQETLTNILRHAPDDAGTPTTIIVEVLQDRVAVQILYEGESFQPEEIATLPALTEYPERGFGLYIIEHSVDSVTYARQLDGRNCIKLVKAF